MPKTAVPMHSMTRFAPVLLRSASRRTGSRGRLLRISITANAASSTADAASEATTSASPQWETPSGLVAALDRPLAHVFLATGARAAQLVDRQPGGHGGHERARRGDLLAGLQRLMHPQQRFLHHVLGLGHGAEHPVGDRERDRPQLGEQLLPRAHVANPCRQLGCPGCHPSSRLALALEAPRSSVISTAPASPATNRGTRTGFLAPSSRSIACFDSLC